MGCSQWRGCNDATACSNYLARVSNLQHNDVMAGDNKPSRNLTGTPANQLAPTIHPASALAEEKHLATDDLPGLLIRPFGSSI